MAGKMSKRLQVLPIIHSSKTSYTFGPALLNGLNDSDVLYAANIPNTAAVVKYWARVAGKESNHKVWGMTHGLGEGIALTHQPFVLHHA